jgi:hypothetical protein
MRLLAAFAVLLGLTVVHLHGEVQVVTVALALALAAAILRARPA